MNNADDQSIAGQETQATDHIDELVNMLKSKFKFVGLEFSSIDSNTPLTYELFDTFVNSMANAAAINAENAFQAGKMHGERQMKAGICIGFCAGSILTISILTAVNIVL